MDISLNTLIPFNLSLDHSLIFLSFLPFTSYFHFIIFTLSSFPSPYPLSSVQHSFIFTPSILHLQSLPSSLSLPLSLIFRPSFPPFFIPPSFNSLSSLHLLPSSFNSISLPHKLRTDPHFKFLLFFFTLLSNLREILDAASSSVAPYHYACVIRCPKMYPTAVMHLMRESLREH